MLKKQPTILKGLNMSKLDKNKLAGLKTFDDHLQETYGPQIRN